MIDLSVFGLDTQTLSDQSTFKPTGSSDNVLLLDGDGLCYEASAGAARKETALRRFERAILETMYMAGCDSARVHLTPKGCLKNGRGKLLTVKPYQGQRSNNKKPEHLEYLRSPACVEYIEKNHPNIKILLQYKIEADDALMIDHYQMVNGILVSPDKDLLISPFKSYNVEEGRHVTLPNGDTFGWIDRKHWSTPSGKPASKMIGKGHKFFLAQLLMGDTADNVQGILKFNGKLCGEAAAHAILNPIEDRDEAVNVVIEGYRKIDQNIIPEAEAMWLLRNNLDSGYKFLMEHDLTNLNKEFLEDCFNRKWFNDEDTDETIAEDTP